MGGHPTSTLIDAHPSFCALCLFLLLTFLLLSFLLLSYYNIMIFVQVSAQVGAFFVPSAKHDLEGFWWSMVYMTINCEGPYNHNDRFWQAVAVRSPN